MFCSEQFFVVSYGVFSYLFFSYLQLCNRHASNRFSDSLSRSLWEEIFNNVLEYKDNPSFMLRDKYLLSDDDLQRENDVSSTHDPAPLVPANIPSDWRESLAKRDKTGNIHTNQRRRRFDSSRSSMP